MIVTVNCSVAEVEEVIKRNWEKFYPKGLGKEVPFLPSPPTKFYAKKERGEVAFISFTRTEVSSVYVPHTAWGGEFVLSVLEEELKENSYLVYVKESNCNLRKILKKIGEKRGEFYSKLCKFPYSFRKIKAGVYRIGNEVVSFNGLYFITSTIPPETVAEVFSYPYVAVPYEFPVKDGERWEVYRVFDPKKVKYWKEKIRKLRNADVVNSV